MAPITLPTIQAVDVARRVDSPTTTEAGMKVDVLSAVLVEMGRNNDKDGGETTASEREALEGERVLVLVLAGEADGGGQVNAESVVQALLNES